MVKTGELKGLFMKIKCFTIDKSNQTIIEEYEKELYKAFKTTEIKTLQKIWHYDDVKKRIKTRVPYTNQEIYALSLDNKITAALTINFNMNDTLQLEMMGFSIDKSEEGLCEGLVLFSQRKFVGNNILIADVSKYAIQEMKNRNIKKFYGTCSKEKLRMYTLMQFEIIDKRVFRGEEKYLLVQELENACKINFPDQTYS